MKAPVLTSRFALACPHPREAGGGRPPPRWPVPEACGRSHRGCAVDGHCSLLRPWPNRGTDAAHPLHPACDLDTGLVEALVLLRLAVPLGAW